VVGPREVAHRLEVQALTDFLRSNNIEVLNSRPTGIEGARRLRMDADDIALS